MSSKSSKSVKPDMAKYVGKRVIIRTTGKKEYTGILLGFDSFLNISMESMQERNKNQEPVGDIFTRAIIRGSVIELVESLDPVQVTNYAPNIRQ